MIVSSSGKIVAGSKILINETINEFLGTVDNLWNNPANWSLGLLPTENHVAVIKADCIDASGVVRSLIVDTNIKISLLNYSVFSTDKLFNFGTIFREAGNGNNVSVNVVINSTVFGLFNVAPNSGLTIVSAEPILDLTSQINHNSKLNFLNLIGNIGIRGIIANITNIIQLQTSTMVNVLDNLTIDIIGGSGVGSTIRLANGVKLEANNVFTDGNASGVLCEGNNEIIIKNNYTVGYGYQIPITVPVIFKGSNSTLKISNKNVPPYVHNIIVDNVAVATTNNYDNICTIFNSRLNGTTLSSEFILETGHALNFLGNTDLSEEELMSIGVLTLKADSALNYALEGDQFIKPLSYKRLGVMGAGVKFLKSNTLCDHLYFAGTATLDLNGYTISGYTKYTDLRDTLLNLPAGLFEDLTFYGQKELSGDLTVTNLYSEAGTIASNGHLLTVTNFYNGAYTLYGLQPSEAIVTNWYNIAGYGAQPVQGGNYQNLYLMGTNSTQVLFGNVVVNGEYVRGNNAQIDKNGFTIKDANGNDLE